MLGIDSDFRECLLFSKGERSETDRETIQNMLTGCVSVDDAPRSLDRKGIDYIATLSKGGEVYIDAKNRHKGCSVYWKNDRPDLALETWSVMPGGIFRTSEDDAKPGWTLSESSQVDYILFKFHPDDHTFVYLVPFQLLRVAFIEFVDFWKVTYPVKRQVSKRWQSECVFVPVDDVYEAIRRVSTTQLRNKTQDTLQIA